METFNAQAELPKAIRSFIRIGAYFKDVIDKADVNAKARAEAGQQPNLLDDVMKDGQVHIANLEEVLADITGRSKAKSMIELMTHAHGLMGVYNTMTADKDGAGEVAEAPRRASSQAPRPANHGSPPLFRPDLTSDASPAEQAGTSAASAPGAASAPTAPTATAPTAPTATAPTIPTETAPTAPTATAPTTDLEATLNALTMQVARHLQTFEEAVAVEQAELRGRMIQQSLETAGLRARIQVLESKLVPAASAPASATEEHAAVPAATPVAAAAPVAAPAAEPVVAPADEPAAEPSAGAVNPAANVDPATVTHGEAVDTKIAACAVTVSNMLIASHTRVQASITEQYAQSRAKDLEILNLRNEVIRLEGIAEKSDGQRPVVEDDPIVAPPSESRLE